MQSMKNVIIYFQRTWNKSRFEIILCVEFDARGGGGRILWRLFTGVLHFLKFNDNLLWKIWLKRHPALEFLANNNTV